MGIRVFWLLVSMVSIVLWGLCWGRTARGDVVFPDGTTVRSVVHNDPGEAVNQGKQFAKAGKYREALTQYEFALARYHDLHNTQGEADVTSDIAVIYRKMGNFQQALALQQQAVHLYIQLGDVLNHAKALRRLGVLYRHQGRLFQAITYQEQALALLEQEHDQEGIANILTNLGIVYGELGRLLEAQQYFERALTIYTHLRKQSGISYILGNLGQLFLYVGDSQQALEYLNRSISIKRDLSDERGEANTLLNMGTAHKNLGDFQKALTLYYQAFDLYKRLNDRRGQAAALGNIGSAYEELGDLAQAQQFQQHSLELKRENGTPIQISVALTNLASLAIKQRRFAEADSSLQEALHIAIEHNSVLSQANIYGQVGFSHLYRKQFPEAIDAFSHSLHLYENMGSQKGVLEALTGYGQVYFLQKRFHEALQYYEQALQLAEDLNDMNALWMVQYYLGRIHLEQDDENLAIGSFQASIMTLEQMRSYLQVPELRQLFMRKNINPYTEMIRLLLQRGNDEEALLYLERFKARTFLEMVSYGKPQLQRIPTLIREEQGLSARIRFLNGRLLSSAKPNFSLKRSEDLEQELKQAKEKYEQLLLRIKLQYPDYYRLKIVDTQEIQRLIQDARQLLEDDVAILEYFFDETLLHVWILEKDHLYSLSQEVSRDAIIEHVLRFRTELANYESTDIVKPLQQLYTWLIAPAEPYLRDKTIVGIVPFQILHFLPFSALIHPIEEPENSDDDERDRTPNYFIENYALFMLPSLSVLPVVRESLRHNEEQAATHPKHFFLGIGNATEDLPGAEEEIQTILGYFQNSKGYTGEDATKQRFFHEAGSYQVLHLATHGVFDKYHPMFSSLEFSPKSYVYAREIFGLQLRATLVTLSGCETFLPQQIGVDDFHASVSGDEFVGFIRAFMYAGVPSVLASLWRVDDTATQYLMSAFYQNLSNLGKAKALQEASHAVIRTTLQIGRRKKKDLRLVHPFFWSSFVLIGDWK